MHYTNPACKNNIDYRPILATVAALALLVGQGLYALLLNHTLLALFVSMARHDERGSWEEK